MKEPIGQFTSVDDERATVYIARKMFLITDFDTQLQGASAQEILSFFLEKFGSELTLSSSLGMEDQVLTHMLSCLVTPPDVFVLDTGRLHEQTYELLELSRATYAIPYRVFYPDTEAVQALVCAHGPNLFYQSVDYRKACCHVRKVEPLRRALQGYKVWVTGQRRDQSVTRAELPFIEWDAHHHLVKLNPLATWTLSDVEAYVQSHHVPINRLHQHGYPSIGCEPCTRAVKAGEPLRSGRWWWEDPDGKECGLHVSKKEVIS